MAIGNTNFNGISVTYEKLSVTSAGSGTSVSAASVSLSAASASSVTGSSQTSVSSDAGEAAVYEKSSEEETASSVTNHKIDYDTIEKLKADAEERTAQLRGLVEKLLLKQSGTVLNSEGLASIYRKLEVDDETRQQAQEDTAEDGYWGAEQTSDRILSFAQALAGDDADLAQQMLEAVKEGFSQAEDEWGEELPELSQQTMQATYDKLNAWIESLGGSTSDSSTEDTQA